MNESELALIKVLLKQLEADYRGYDEDGIEDDYTMAEREHAIANTKSMLHNAIDCL